MDLSHKGTFAVTSLIFGLGLFIVFLLPQNLGSRQTIGSSAQTAPVPPPGQPNPPGPAGPGGTRPGTNVPPNTPGGTTTNSSGLSCQNCDVDGSGTIDGADITLIQQALQQNPGNQKAQQFLAFCTPLSNPATPVTSCSTTGGGGGPNVTVPPTKPSVPPVSQTPSGGNNPIGDCNSAQGPGQKDGRTDLLDFELLRQELAGEAQTTHCDFDGNGSVDIVDFTNYLRIGLNS